MSLVLRQLRQSLSAAGFDCAWEWTQLEAPDSRRAELNCRDVARVEQAPAAHDNVPAGDEVDREESQHNGQYSHNVSVGQP